MQKQPTSTNQQLCKVIIGGNHLIAPFFSPLNNTAMNSSAHWLQYFEYNAQQHRINWNQPTSITPQETVPILASLQAWQLGETSDGRNLLNATKRFAQKTNDPLAIDVMKRFIKEEQKHGENLGKYLDRIHQPRIQQNWGDSLFRKVRHLNTSMQWWTLTVITVECAAQIFYQCLKNATHCKLLREICTDILIDEAPHIRFQQERMQLIFERKHSILHPFLRFFYRCFFFTTALVIWQAHQKLFKAGGYNFKRFWTGMSLKYRKTIGRLHPAQNDSLPASSKFYQRKPGFIYALYHAFEGITHFFAHERNGRIQAFISAVTLIAGIALHISLAEWMAVLICMGIVISLEMLNTSVEELCNRIEPGFHPGVKIIKDVAAGAVLFASMVSLALAALIFLPKIIAT